MKPNRQKVTIFYLRKRVKIRTEQSFVWKLKRNKFLFNMCFREQGILSLRTISFRLESKPLIKTLNRIDYISGYVHDMALGILT